MPRFAKFLPLGLVIIFGLPFLMLTDLFPFHRYGMFARMPAKNPESEVRILTANEGKWKQLQTHSPNLDKGALPGLAAAAFGNPVKEKSLVEKILPSINPVPDSIALIKTAHPKPWKRIVYP